MRVCLKGPCLDTLILKESLERYDADKGNRAIM